VSEGDLFVRHGATPAEADELAAYTRDQFVPPVDADAQRWPLPDEPFVAAWRGYADAAERGGAWPELRRRLVQLRFPVREGMSAEPEYLGATRKGIVPADGAEGASLVAPERLRVWLHPTPAGRLPVIVAGARADFETLVRALTRRNEPQPVPASMGACIVGGYNNWDRVASLRAAWARGEGIGAGGDWDSAFREIMGQRDLYQDRFVLLSEGPYSGTPAAALGLDDAEWAAASLTLRLEHECAHYFTRRVFGSMSNTLRDELIADFMGIAAVAGRFRAEWFLRFMGLEDFPRYRAGGRLENYRGTPPLSDGAFVVLGRLVHAAAHNLEEWGGPAPAADDFAGKARVLHALSSMTLERMAAGRMEPVAA
jgi:hypothetical protein